MILFQKEQSVLFSYTSIYLSSNAIKLITTFFMKKFIFFSRRNRETLQKNNYKKKIFCLPLMVFITIILILCQSWLKSF